MIFSDSFDEITFKTATLYVPYGMKAVMGSKSIWQNFLNIVESDLSTVNEISGDVDFSETEYYNINGMRIDSPEPGQVVIKRAGNKGEKVVM